MRQPQISIILLNFNGKKYLKRCLDSIENQTFKNFEVIIIDNGSTDNSKNEIWKKYSHYQIIDNPTNLGFAKANNAGVALARGEYLFFLNIDTHLKKDCLEKLMAAAKEEEIFNPCQMSYDEKEFISCGVGLDIFGYPYSLEKNFLDPKQVPFYADGAALFISKDFFNFLQGFDESTFLFHEDIDLSWKARLVGKEIIRIPEAVVFHVSGGILEGGAIKGKEYITNHFRRYLGERNNIRNLLKNYSLTTLLWILPLYWLINLGEILFFTLTFNFRAVWGYLKAWLWNLTYLPDTISKRREIQPKRKVSDWEIQKKMLHSSAKFKIFLKIGGPKFR